MKDQKSKRGRGAPTKYDPDFHPEDFIKQSSEGQPVFAIAASWKVHKDSIYEWVKVHEDFSDAFKIGHSMREAWWFNLGKDSMLGKKSADLGFYCYLTRSALGWRDRDAPVISDESVKEIEVKITKHEKANN
jgi:hypothetical protein